MNYYYLIKLIFISLCLNYSLALLFKYHTHEELIGFMRNFTNHQNMSKEIITTYYTIGKTVMGRDLAVIKITSSRNNDELKPNVKLIGNIHGNEPVGREILLHFLEYLVNSYKKYRKVTWLLDNTNLHIMPSLNPDGFAIADEGDCTGDDGRANGKHVDLNRNFPDYFKDRKGSVKQPEVKSVEEWMNNVPFILSASLHGGALVANYPFDTVAQLTSLRHYLPSLTPDDDVFRHLSKIYANQHPTMHLGNSCINSTRFDGGITNGAAWYPLRGGMQDYNYFKHGCMELTLEISCCKYPKARELLNHWNANSKALIALCLGAHEGVRGYVKDSLTEEPINAAILKVRGREMQFHTDEKGRFWRILLPGRYQLEVSASGYHNQTIEFMINKTENFRPTSTIMMVNLINNSIPLRTSVEATEIEEKVQNQTTTSKSPAITTGATVSGYNVDDYTPSIIVAESKHNSAINLSPIIMYLTFSYLSVAGF